MMLHHHIGSIALVLGCLPQLILGQGDALGLAKGYTNVTLSNFNVKIVKEAQVLASLTGFNDTYDFLPFDLIANRSGNGQYHWGDITYRYREQGSANWTSGDSSQTRQAVTVLPARGSIFAASNLSPTLPSSPLNITREWLDVSGDLGLRFTVRNTGPSAIELGSLGLPVEFNNIFTNRQPIDMQRLCSLFDPYIGMHAAHIRVTPVSGTGSAVVVTGLKGAVSTPMEAWRNLEEPFFDATQYGSQTFEGLYEWQVLTKAWAENEWAAVEPWNPPSSLVLKPGQSVQFGVRFSTADNIRDLNSAISKTETPVALAVPGYIVQRDLPAKLVLQTSSNVNSISVEPAGAVQVVADGDKSYTITASPSSWGRLRLTVSYEDGTVQTIHYYIVKPTSQVLSDLGRAMTTDAWFTNTSDPFGRAPSVMTFDQEENAIVQQDPRVWVAGLSDEGGVGAYLATMVKQSLLPDVNELSKLEDFVDGVIWKTIQQTNDSAVRKAIFYYQPAAMPNFDYNDSFDWTTWTSWDISEAYAIDRAYDYVHVAASYWSLYRVARAYPDVLRHPWDWFLTHAYNTVIRMMGSDVGYNMVGLMGETVYGEMLKDLQRENMISEASTFEAAMKTRAELWQSQEIPYGSEMAWDSTGQEGVYYWTK